MKITESDAVEWDAEIPLLTNRYILAGLAKAILGGSALVTALVSLLLAIQGEWNLIPRVAGLLFGIGVLLLLVALLVMRVAFRNRLLARFRVDADGVAFETTDRTVLIGNRAALLLGLAMGKPAAAGSGLLATLQESQRLRWGGAFRASGEAATHSIAFRNGWRTLMRIYCRPEEYEAVLVLVRRYMTGHGTAGRLPHSTPVAAQYILRTLWVVLSCLPVFYTADSFGLSRLSPFLFMCFGIAMIWLVNGLAWITLGLGATVVAMSFLGAIAPRTSFSGQSTYLRYETLSGDSWAITVLGLLGIVSVTWLAVSILRGHVKPALQADEESAGLL